MPSALFEALDSVGFLRGDTVNVAALERAAATELIDFAERSVELTSVQSLPRSKSIFSYTASLSLSGHDRPCSRLNCRLERVEELAQFAALYSDNIYISNPFLEYCKWSVDNHSNHLSRRKSKIDGKLLKQEIMSDLLILAKLRPLVEAGRITVIAPSGLCADCVTQRFGSDFLDRLSAQRLLLTNRYIEQVSWSMEVAGAHYCVYMDGPEDLLPHGHIAIVYRGKPSWLQKIPRVMTQLVPGARVRLSKEECVAVEDPAEMADEAVRNITLDLIASQVLGTAFLTDAPLQIDILNTLFADSALTRRNAFLRNYMTTIVPFANDISVRDLLKLRTREEESFVLFRDGLNRAVEEILKSRTQLTETDAKALYSEFVVPRVAALDLKIKAAKRDLVKSTRRRVLGWSAAISLGIYAGFVPSELVAAAGALGLSKVVAELVELAMAKSDTEEAIRSEQMYFLWRVKRGAKK